MQVYRRQNYVWIIYITGYISMLCSEVHAAWSGGVGGYLDTARVGLDKRTSVGMRPVSIQIHFCLWPYMAG